LNRFKQDLFQEEMLWPKNNLTYGFGLNIFFTQGFLEKTGFGLVVNTSFNVRGNLSSVRRMMLTDVL